MISITAPLRLLACFIAALLAPCALAEEKSGSDAQEELVAIYDFYVGGLPIGVVRIDAALDAERYHIKSSLQTRGILEMMMRGRLQARAEGALTSDARPTPELYETVYSSRDGAQRMAIAYRDAAPIWREAEPALEEASHDIDPYAQYGALDPASALLAGLVSGVEDSLCARTIPIFDGRWRYDVILLPYDPEMSDPDAPEPAWDAPLTRCLGVYERIAGFEPDILEKQRYVPFDIWFESLPEGGARAVRIAGKTRLGYALGNLRPKED